jgi:hypothetical protein
MYHIPFAAGIMLVDCRWDSYDPDRFEIYSMEWRVDETEIGVSVPKSVWWDLHLSPSQMDQEAGIHMYSWMGTGAYIHEYIFEWMCNNEPMESTEWAVQ